MRMIFLLFLLLTACVKQVGAIAVPTVAVAPTVITFETMIVCGTDVGLNVRSSAGASGPVLRFLSPGARVVVFEIKGDWIRVGRIKSEWVNAGYLCK
jgi:hypothetical protein